MELSNCNTTELLELIRVQGLGRLKSTTPKDILIGVATGSIPVPPEYISGTMETRSLLEQYITKNWNRVANQLPGCDGKCTTYPCTEATHSMCFTPNRGAVK